MITAIDLSKMSKTKKEAFLFFQEIDNLLCKKFNGIDNRFDQCFYCSDRYHPGCYPECPLNGYDINEGQEIMDMIRNIRNYIDNCCNELSEDAIVEKL